MLNNARERFDGQSNFNYIHGDYLKADFDDSFDIVVSSLSIHHLEDNEKKYSLLKSLRNSQ